MKYLIPFALFLFQLALMYLIWDKYPASLSKKIFFESASVSLDSEELY